MGYKGTAGVPTLLHRHNLHLLLLHNTVLLPQFLLEPLDLILQHVDFLAMPVLDQLQLPVELLGPLSQQLGQSHEIAVH